MVLSTIIKLRAPHRRQALIRIRPPETLVWARVVTNWGLVREERYLFSEEEVSLHCSSFGAKLAV